MCVIGVESSNFQVIYFLVLLSSLLTFISRVELHDNSIMLVDV